MENATHYCSRDRTQARPLVRSAKNRVDWSNRVITNRSIG